MSDYPYLKHFAEPKLAFGHGQFAEDPRDGLILFGPHEPFNAYSLRYGVMGSSRAIGNFRQFVERINKPIFSIKTNKRGKKHSEDRSRPSFPGFEAVFGVAFPPEPDMKIKISDEGLAKALGEKNKKIRTSKVVDLYLESIVNASNKEDASVDIWFIVIPWEVYKRCNTSSWGRETLGGTEEFIRQTKENNQAVLDFFDLKDYMEEAQRYLDASSDFHHLLKARLIQEGVKIPIQIMVENTARFRDKERNKEYDEYMKAHLAWTQSTSIYYKLGKLPWKLADIRDGVCYLGLVYKKVKDKNNSNVCSAAQMFLKDGDGSVFRGNIGLWESRPNEYHIDRKSATQLIGMALDDYKEKWGVFPSELFIHAKTSFESEEWDGFLEAIKERHADATKLVGITIKNTNPIKLYRDAEGQESNYGILRGMALITSEYEGYIATTGFIPRLNTANCSEIPRMLHVRVSKGKANIETVVKDICGLTKLNYNACVYGDGVPVTLKFSERIGSILTATDQWKVDVRQFKYYI